MTPAELTAWRSRMGWTAKAASEALGLSQHGYAAYERGYVVDGKFAGDELTLRHRPRPIPKHVALACQRLECLKQASLQS